MPTWNSPKQDYEYEKEDKFLLEQKVSIWKKERVAMLDALDENSNVKLPDDVKRSVRGYMSAKPKVLPASILKKQYEDVWATNPHVNGILKEFERRAVIAAPLGAGRIKVEEYDVSESKVREWDWGFYGSLGCDEDNCIDAEWICVSGMFDRGYFVEIGNESYNVNV